MHPVMWLRFIVLAVHVTGTGGAMAITGLTLEEEDLDPAWLQGRPDLAAEGSGELCVGFELGRASLMLAFGEPPSLLLRQWQEAQRSQADQPEARF